ncbi:RtcB family protein [Patescibacteria group bacterium]|nr:RtcB family protein [Patescibacteria group bacterium]
MEIIKSERIPLYIFSSISSIEPDCLRQAKNISNLEPAFHHTSLMPDAHIGYGMPIGGILALKDAICPNAVGVDIGCGMGYVSTNLPSNSLTKNDLRQLVDQIMRDVPTGFSIHKKPRPAPDFLKAPRLPQSLMNELDRAKKSLGTLGGGNHFIDIQKDPQGNLVVLVHSGSRHFGYAIANYYHKKAQNECTVKNRNLPNGDLAYFKIGSVLGQEYIYAMQLAMQYARENRHQLMEAAQESLNNLFGPLEFGEQINAHHNYAALEEHFGQKVWVHRKGAIRAEKDEPVIVPGCMTSHSYIGIGLGNPDSFNSCAHGAGRILGRKEAKRKYNVREIMKDIEDHNIVLGKKSKHDIAEECRFSYKDIEEVIQYQSSLAKMTIRLTPLAVIVG